MKMSELFAKMGFDMNKDVDLPAQDTIQQVVTPTQEQLQQVSEQIKTETPIIVQSSTVEQPDTSNAITIDSLQTAIKLQQAQQEIENLKKMNFALLQQTPVSQEENLSIEERIYRSVIGKPKEG